MDDNSKELIYFQLTLRCEIPETDDFEHKTYWVKPWDVSPNTLNSYLFQNYLDQYKVSSWAGLVNVPPKCPQSNETSSQRTTNSCLHFSNKNNKRKLSVIIDDDDEDYDEDFEEDEDDFDEEEDDFDEDEDKEIEFVTTNNCTRQPQQKRRRVESSIQNDDIAHINDILNLNANHPIVPPVPPPPIVVPQTQNNVNAAGNDSNNKAIPTQLRWI